MREKSTTIQRNAERQLEKRMVLIAYHVAVYTHTSTIQFHCMVGVVFLVLVWLLLQFLLLICLRHRSVVFRCRGTSIGCSARSDVFLFTHTLSNTRTAFRCVSVFVTFANANADHRIGKKNGFSMPKNKCERDERSIGGLDLFLFCACGRVCCVAHTLTHTYIGTLVSLHSQQVVNCEDRKNSYSIVAPSVWCSVSFTYLLCVGLAYRAFALILYRPTSISSVCAQFYSDMSSSSSLRCMSQHTVYTSIIWIGFVSIDLFFLSWTKFLFDANYFQFFAAQSIRTQSVQMMVHTECAAAADILKHAKITCMMWIQYNKKNPNMKSTTTSKSEWCAPVELKFNSFNREKKKKNPNQRFVTILIKPFVWSIRNCSGFFFFAPFALFPSTKGKKPNDQNAYQFILRTFLNTWP